MSVIDKIDKILDEGIMNQGSFIKKVMKGLQKDDIAADVAWKLWHYYNQEPGGVGGIFKTTHINTNNVMDELWYRIGKNIEKSERLTDDALKLLKKNFYSLSKYFNEKYTISKVSGKTAWVMQAE